MTYPMAPQPLATGPTPPPKKRRWVWPVITVVALLVGVGIGSAGKKPATTAKTAASVPAASATPATQTVTVTASAPVVAAAATVTETVTQTATATATVTAQPAAAPTPKATPTKAVAPPPAGQPSDKGWTLVGLTTKNDGLGDFGGTARIINTNNSSQTGVFTITLLKGTTIIASLQGAADGASAGQTVTVQLVSEDPYVVGSFTAQFQTDTSF